jgi:Fe2+ transport system protein B
MKRSAKGLEVDALVERDLGVPAILVTARTGEDPHLAGNCCRCDRERLLRKPLASKATEFQSAVNTLVEMIHQIEPDIPNARWLIRLLDGDAKVQRALLARRHTRSVARQQKADVQFSRKMAVEEAVMETNITPNDVLVKAETLRNNLTSGFRDEIVKSLYAEAEKVARRAVKTSADRKFDLDQKLDRLVTSPITGLPIMLILLPLLSGCISGPNVSDPSPIFSSVLGVGAPFRQLEHSVVIRFL